MPEPGPAAMPPAPDVRVRAFVDFWNFQIALRRWCEATGTSSSAFNLDWRALGPWLARTAGALAVAPAQSGRLVYDGLHVYMSHDPNGPNDRKLKAWAMNTLQRFPGVQITLKDRKPKSPPQCPACHQPVTVCPHCAGNMRGTVEKGIDTAIVTDMIKLAWDRAYEVAVLVSGDRDFVPAVSLLAARGIKTVHAGFAPEGAELAGNCWASLDLRQGLRGLARP